MERYKFIRGMSRWSYTDLEKEEQDETNLIEYLNYLISLNKIDVKTKDKILRYYNSVEIWD